MTGTTQDDYTDRYARRVRGMTTSEIRALFAVASRPEVVSLAGGSPFIAALPLDGVGEMLGRLAAEQGASSLQYGIGQGTVDLRERICEVMALSGIHGASPDDVVVTVGGQQAIDLLARPDATIFPYPAYLIGLREKWLFTAPFDVRPIDLGEGDTWEMEKDTDAAEALAQFITDLTAGRQNAD